MVPEVSVVVATHDRRERIGRLLDALGRQRDAPAFEVVVVDDGSSDGTPAALRVRRGDPFTLTILALDANRGPATARNAGWRAATAALVCFTDDDCVPDEGWLACLTSAGADIAQGRTVPDPAQETSRGPFYRTMVVAAETGFYETCNIAYRRAVLEKLGGFDEGFRFPYGEDTDLAWRAKEGGASTSFVEGAVVRHDVWPSDYLAHLRDMRRREGLVLLYSKHPELRRHFGRRVFFREIHPPTVAAFGALVAWAARPSLPRAAAAAAAGGWYAWVCHLVRPRPRRLWQWPAVVPLAFVADSYEIAVMARASLKYRTVLL